MYFDGKVNRALRYARNQKSPFIDEQDKEAILEHVSFDDGKITVPKEETLLQEILSVLHPKLNTTYKELDFEKMAQEDLERMNIEDEAIIQSRSIDVATAESVLRVYTTAKVDNMNSDEIKRDIRLYARQHPAEFLEALQDSDLKMHNVVSKLLSQGILVLKNNKDVHYNLETNKKKLFTVPLNEDVQDAIIKFFLTDEGLEIYKILETKID